MEKIPDEIVEFRKARAAEALSTLWRNEESELIGPETDLDTFIRVGLESYRDHSDSVMSEVKLARLSTGAIHKALGWRDRSNDYNKRVMNEARVRVHSLLSNNPGLDERGVRKE